MAKSGHTRLEPHRQAWLDAHPERDETWLRRMAKEGFDIHHVDGDHENNDPLNLVLIEHQDHFMLHSGVYRTLRLYRRRVFANTAPRWYAERPARQVEGLTPEERQADAIAEYEKTQLVLVESL